jgi:hypothetical protein
LVGIQADFAFFIPCKLLVSDLSYEIEKTPKSNGDAQQRVWEKKTRIALDGVSSALSCLALVQRYWDVWTRKTH